jgi:hypothetical protein
VHNVPENVADKLMAGLRKAGLAIAPAPPAS